MSQVDVGWSPEFRRFIDALGSGSTHRLARLERAANRAGLRLYRKVVFANEQRYASRGRVSSWEWYVAIERRTRDDRK